ncbi:MAG: DUF2946 domain-containing protein [Acetobacter fabarum]|jgi:hypothetical protein|uniref:DUF2946 domain-containing protein n=1 Tax=Acetobacter fabarum TaxID=483199 RepID=UPI002430AC84|nr:DUF2946 domain-containing protein [Acetobacter fabarum]MCH4024860.1 DUF2946 domain-containing protein [Acetobacter fabarum]MCI1298171.1 DUF2946 domain-containing protein [Acetobacter fabarum]MCI1323488.1 DUF2946 domain-containing protein [Acetobacter fabarum]MCI1420158.1 DUF2946 domain-containing protein [Acetobacter fabarum]MCI1446920.1 DUF2946 domain-containing protein [Acetobacter fabarum]
MAQPWQSACVLLTVEKLLIRPMFRRNPIIRALLLWPLVMVTLAGLVGLMALQSLSLPEELPRATLIRLTGIDIAPHAAQPHSAQAHCAPMPGGSMHHMHCMASAQKNQQQHPAHHHDEASCPLCPLLAFFAALPAVFLLLPAPALRWIRRGSAASAPRAPPACILGLPPSRGPPLTLLQAF